MVLKVLTALRLWSFLVGMTFSFTFGVWWCRYLLPLHIETSGRKLCEKLQQAVWERPQIVTQEIRTRKLLFIGVMTSQRFLFTRAKGVYDTWGKTISGRLIFFAGTGNTTRRTDFPVVFLPVPDNVHPPQRKSLAMLKYIYDHYINHYQWFVRADDDVYIRPERLVAFLQKLDSSKTLLLGQAGTGKQHERGKLGLRNGDNFCMGGPGIVMSSGVLKAVSPHLGYCLNNTATFHEDTEVGRCLRNFAGVMCPWAYEARELFHQVYEKQDKAYHGNLFTASIDNAITLHPIKDPAYMRRIHLHYQIMATHAFDYKAWLLKHQLKNLKKAAEKEGDFKMIFERKVDFFGEIFPNTTAFWETFGSRQIYSLFEDAPLRWIHDSVRDGLVRLVQKAKKQVHVYGAAQKYHSTRFTKDFLGYINHHPLLGSQFIARLATVNVLEKSPLTRQKRSTSVHLLKFQQPFTSLRYRLIDTNDAPTVHFVVPLAGRFSNFRRFLVSFEHAFLSRGKKVKLLVVYFSKLKDPSKHKKLLRMYKEKYPLGVFHWLDVNTSTFQRGLALNLGSRYFGHGALLSITDVDLVFKVEYLFRCQRNAKRGKQVYFPIMFSKFHPNISRISKSSKPHSDNPFIFHKDAGAWRVYSYGPVCVYSDDVTAVGGFNTTIKGWGFEDVEFFEKFVRRGKMRVIRAPDRGLVHVFHKHAPCSPRSTFRQQKMCHDATAAYLSSASSAIDYLMRKKHWKFKDYI